MKVVDLLYTTVIGIGESVAGDLIQLLCEGMVCGSTGVFHAAAQSGCPGQSLLVHGAGLPPASSATLPPPPPLTPITTPGEVVQVILNLFNQLLFNLKLILIISCNI